MQPEIMKPAAPNPTLSSELITDAEPSRACGAFDRLEDGSRERQGRPAPTPLRVPSSSICGLTLGRMLQACNAPGPLLLQMPWKYAANQIIQSRNYSHAI